MLVYRPGMEGGRRLIVNADDLGRTPGINRGVFAAHHHGIVSSATLMVNYAAAAEVKGLSREYPALGIGLHLALTGGRSSLQRLEEDGIHDEAM